MFYLGQKYLDGGSHLPLWRTDGIVMTILLHTGPVEFLYYWLHRYLHHHFLYSRYHSHHHSSTATEPITSVIHPFGEHLMYFTLFMIPLLNMVFTGTGSIVAFAAYITYIDFMNNMGHWNFEFVPSSLFKTFPFLKCIFYTASYHSLHHTQFRTNYALFMPMYDYIYGTMDKSSDDLYETSLKRTEESPDVVHLTHPTTPDSIYHLRLGFASLASKPYMREANNKHYFIIKWILWPLTFLWSVLFQRMLSHTFVLERNIFDDHHVTKKLLQVQTWAIPRYSYQYKRLTRQRGTINSLIEKAILDADKAGAEVISLGLLNQGEEMNRNGEVYIQKHPNLKIKIVDGSSLAAAIVLNSITNLTAQQKLVVMMRGRLTKVACHIALALCRKGVQVVVKLQSTDDFEKLRSRFFSTSSASQASSLAVNNLIPFTKYNNAHGNHQVWLVDDEFSSEEHMSAPKETIFIPYSQIPPWSNFKKNPIGAANILRKDCVYYSTPPMMIPSSLENVHSCENWLPRRVMSAWRVAGMLHALEDWEGHERGNWFIKEEDNMIDKVWAASLRHGFRPYYLLVPCTSTVIAA
ncbi:protein ECERIFERUM 1-like [Papaver somniferum]|uniref:protein ECERIFERUM 1-like n=1 Tax=Papaver somniferum TaxID=3469 RepID=UPI000E6F88DA|nr:protein ECERIFERUM 1-like [Papaver somniferum]